MTFNYIALAIPAVLAAIGAEFLISKKKKQNVFHFNNSVANLSVGIAERSLNIFFAGFSFKLFDFLHYHFSIFSLSTSWYNWIILLLLTDFLWYWYHRLGHEVNIFWAFHVVHHQSEDFNYTASVRITTFQALVRILFWSLLPLIGFPPQMVTVILIVHGGYSFLTHTELIKSMGWLEKVFITPSLHRVHHASNIEYLDKNYGDIFVFWDKLFGTFKVESAKPVYGLTQPLNSFSFLWQHFHFLCEVFYKARKEKKLKGKLKILFGRPDILDGTERQELEKYFFKENNKIIGFSVRYKKYILWQIAVSLLVSFLLILLYENFSFSVNIGAIALLLTTMVNCGALLEHKTWVFKVEYIRYIIVVLFALYFSESELNALILFVFFLPLFWYSSLKQQYFKLLFN